jgi:hypothetical protein
MSVNQAEVPYFPADMMRLMGIKHPNTLRIYIKENRVPEPDVRITAKTRYWHRSTLVRAGLLKDENAAKESANH